MTERRDDETGASESRRTLHVLSSAASEEGQACTTCTSNVYIWEEEVELVRAMNEVKQQVRATKAGDRDADLPALRDRFRDLRKKMEKVRRRRLDSLGHYEYD